MAHGHGPSNPALHGLIAEFETPTALVQAATRARLEGYTSLDAYSPMPIPELDEALDLGPTKVPLLCLLGGIGGGAAGYGLQYWASTSAYALNIGGRPLHSWPHFIPVTFETTVLGAALMAFFGMWALNGLPKPYHPVFNVPAFARASRDRFFLCIEATDPKFDRTATSRFLESLGPVGVSDVEE
jgi:hypothetical protein